MTLSCELSGLPGNTQLLPLPAVKIIPRIFRIRWRSGRPSANEAGHIPSWHGSCERYALALARIRAGPLLPAVPDLDTDES